MENISEGILLIVTGVTVVLVLLVLMSLLVRFMNLLDDFFAGRKRKKEERKVSLAEPVEQEEISPETIAAISLALNDYLKARPAAAVSGLSRPVSQNWPASGRLEIMANNQKITSRLR